MPRAHHFTRKQKRMPAKGQICLVDGCYKPVRCRGLCSLHYNRLLTKGEVGEVKARRATNGEPWVWLLDNAKHLGDDCLIWPFGKAATGYAVVQKPVGGYTKAHRAMCVMAHGEPAQRDMVARHSCDNKRCVNPRHLSWGTQAQNAAEAIERGLTPKGEECKHAKLSAEDVRAIRKKRDAGATYAALGAEYGISKGSIWHAVQGTQWGHVK